MKNLKSSVLFLMAILLLNGCGSSEIQGTVKDPFGNNMEGVEVSIEKSDLKSSTGKYGHYSIPYILGTFTLKYSKPGYTTQKMTLTITEKTQFPAQPVTIYPIPTESGLFYIGEKSLIKMYPGKTIMQEIYNNLEDKGQVNFSPDRMMESPIKPGKAQFIDRTSLQLIPMRLRADRRFLQLLTAMKGFDIRVAYDGLVKEERTLMGEENLLIRTINCDPGNYAWVELSNEILPFVGRKLPKAWGACYAFKAKIPDRQENGKIDKKTEGGLVGHTKMLPEPVKIRFTKGEDGFVSDSTTCLEWYIDEKPGINWRCNWHQAKAWTESLNCLPWQDSGYPIK
jgi:hypothetical protein